MIVIIDSGGANIASVKFALERLGTTSVLTDDPAVIGDAEKVLLPGVGAAPVAMQRLIDSGLVDCIRGLTQPVMGCLGMQLRFPLARSTPLLGLFDAGCTSFTPAPDLIVPHMGWNRLSMLQTHPLLDGVTDGSYVYFVHSFYACDRRHGRVVHSNDFTAIVARDNFTGCSSTQNGRGRLARVFCKISWSCVNDYLPGY